MLIISYTVFGATLLISLAAIQLQPRLSPIAYRAAALRTEEQKIRP